MAEYRYVTVPEGGAKIEMKDGKLAVPDNPIIRIIRAM